MTGPLTVEYKVHFQRRGHGNRKQVREGKPPEPVQHTGRVPRVVRLLALAIRFDRLLREGKVADYADLARLGHVSRARITQIMNLLLLAPDIQEKILFLPLVEQGHDRLHMHQLQAIALVYDWRKQRKLWRVLEEKTKAKIKTP
jgi:hypothetical protein